MITQVANNIRKLGKKRINLTGKHIGLWTVLYPSKKRTKHNGLMWVCRCDCGKIRAITSSALLAGHSNSCGCIHKTLAAEINNKYHDNTCKTKLYHIWTGIKDRCYNKNAPRYKNYGGRGIIICNEWKEEFLNFKFWALNNGYKEGLTIERIDVNGNYCPENCKFIPKQQQAFNKQNTIKLTYKGQTKRLKEWADLFNIKYDTLHNRIKNMGLEIDTALNYKRSKK